MWYDQDNSCVWGLCLLFFVMCLLSVSVPGHDHVALGEGQIFDTERKVIQESNPQQLQGVIISGGGKAAEKWIITDFLVKVRSGWQGLMVKILNDSCDVSIPRRWLWDMEDIQYSECLWSSLKQHIYQLSLSMSSPDACSLREASAHLICSSLSPPRRIFPASRSSCGALQGSRENLRLLYPHWHRT